MKKFFISLMVCTLIFFAGCRMLRFAPDEVQKQNAWLHNRTVAMVSEVAQNEEASDKLRQLTDVAELQSRAFISYYGLPEEFPKADTIEDVLRKSNIGLAHTALAVSAQRPDAWQMVDAALQMGIGICALLGGVYGTRAVKFLKQAKNKSNALKEIIEGNELFKKAHETSTGEFKQAHRNQSPQTRKIVAELKH